jgi:hypothetical protein
MRKNESLYGGKLGKLLLGFLRRDDICFNKILKIKKKSFLKYIDLINYLGAYF